MAYRNEMTIDERIVHHSWESYYAACFACELHEQAEAIKSGAKWPSIDDMPLPVAVAVVESIPALAESVGKLADAGLEMATKYTNLLSASIQNTASAWGIV